MKKRLIVFILCLITPFSHQLWSQENQAPCSPSVSRRVLKVEALLQQNMGSAARSLYEQKLADADCWEAKVVYSEVLFKSGQRALGLQHLEKLLDENPTDLQLREQKAFFVLELAETGKTQAFIDGTLVPTLFETPLSDREFKRSNWQRAVELFEALPERTPARIHLLGYIHKQLQNPAQAQFYWEQLKDDSLYRQDVWLELSVLYRQTNQTEKYLDALLETEKMYPKNLHVLRELAQTLHQRHDERWKEYEQKHAFYANQPDFLTIPYSAEHAQKFQELTKISAEEWKKTTSQHTTAWMIWALLQANLDGKTAYSLQSELIQQNDVSLELLQEALFYATAKIVWGRFAEVIAQRYPKQAARTLLHWETVHLNQVDFTTEKSWLIVCQNSRTLGSELAELYRRAKQTKNSRNEQLIRFFDQYLSDQTKKKMGIAP